MDTRVKDVDLSKANITLSFTDSYDDWKQIAEDINSLARERGEISFALRMLCNDIDEMLRTVDQANKYEIRVNGTADSE